MSKAESAPFPEEQPDAENIVFFSQSSPEQPGSMEFEVDLLRSIMSSENANFLLDKAEELGVEVDKLLDSAIESYAALYKVFERGRPLFYLGSDGKMHSLDDQSDQPQAV